jgi:hypothetical protein
MDEVKYMHQHEKVFTREIDSIQYPVKTCSFWRLLNSQREQILSILFDIFAN